MGISDRIKSLRQQLGISQEKFGSDIGISRSSVAQIETGGHQPTLETVVAIVRKYNISYLWLMEGGDVNLNVNPTVNLNAVEEPSAHLIAHPSAHLNVEKGINPAVITVDKAGEDNIVMVSTKAAASYPVRLLEPEFWRELPAFNLPGGEYRNGIFRAFEVQGDSMSDTLYAGDVVVCRYLDGHFSEIRDGYVHVVVTQDEVLVKRVINRVKQGKLILKSDNESYSNIVLNIDQVREVWLVKSKISLYLPNKNAEIGKVLTDLQARMALMEEELYGKGSGKRLSRK